MKEMFFLSKKSKNQKQKIKILKNILGHEQTRFWVTVGENTRWEDN